MVVLAVLDLVVLGVGYRARGGDLPPLQRTSPSFPVPTGTPTGETDPVEAEDSITGPLLLGVNASGMILRATRGACEERSGEPTRVSVGTVDDVRAGGELADVTAPDVLEVLGLMVYADGSMRVSGLDQDCASVTFDSNDEGATWTPVAVPGIRRLPGDTTASDVLGPRNQKLTVGCPPTQLVNLPGRRAVASCESTAFFPLPSGAQLLTLQALGFDQLSVTPSPDEGRYYAFGATAGCGAQVGEVDAETQSIDERACLGDGRAPLAIAAAGDLIVLQVGNSVVVSDDGGDNFSPVLPDLGATG